jgi:hypothetical protein
MLSLSYVIRLHACRAHIGCNFGYSRPPICFGTIAGTGLADFASILLLRPPTQKTAGACAGRVKSDSTGRHFFEKINIPPISVPEPLFFVACKVFNRLARALKSNLASFIQQY